jgi:MFS family permease
MGVGMAFALAAIGALVLDNSRPEETGVTSGMNSIMRTTGAAIGAQVAAALLAARTPPGSSVPLESAFTLAFAIGAVGLVAGLLVTLVLEYRSVVVPQPQAAPAA